MIEIDGSYREGGGQILRTACVLSCVTGKAFHIFNIRKGRKSPGLKEQHLWGLKALTNLYKVKVEGGKLGSTELSFAPSKPLIEATSEVKINIPTAGSISLVLQTLILPFSLFKRQVKIIFDGGATDTFFSPTINYYLYVLFPLLKKMGYKITVKIIKRGYYPKGGAKVETIIYPANELKGINITRRGKLQKIYIFSYASEFLKKKRVAERQVEGAIRKLQPINYESQIKYFNTLSPGSSIDIIAEYEHTLLGSNALGKIGKKAEKVGEEGAQILLEDMYTEGCIDRYMSDQILPYIAIAQTTSKCKIAKLTEHCLTNMWVVEKFMDHKFLISNNIIQWQKC